MKNNLKKRIAARLCAAALLAMMVPVVSAAAPTIALSSAAVTQGGTCTVTVTGSELSALSILKLTIAYDESAFTVMETAVRSMDIATADFKTQAGLIEYSGISMEGLNGTQELLSITFRAEANTPAGKYPVTMFCSEAAAVRNGADESISVSVASGTLTVSQSSEVYFNLYADRYTIESGEEVTLTVSSWWLNNLAGGKFVFQYDRNQFSYQSLELLSAVTDSKAVYSINQSNEGRILLSFASEEAIRTGDLMRITLKTKNGVSETAQITLETSELVDINAASVKAAPTYAYVTIAEKASVWLDLPDEMNTHEPFLVGFWAGGTSGLAAGDFSVSYDPEKLECMEVISTSASNTYLEINDAWNDGSVEFSVLSPQGINRDTQYLTIVFRARQQLETEFTLTPAATTAPVNRYGVQIAMEYEQTDGVIVLPDHECMNGYCTQCETDVASILVKQNEVCVVVPGVEAGASAYVAVYNKEGKLLACQMKSWNFELPMVCTVRNMPAEVDVRVFVLGGEFEPVRKPIQ